MSRRLPLPRVLSSPAMAAAWLAVALLPGLAAAATRTFRQASAKDFEEGETTGSALLPTGELVPGMVATRIPVDAAFVWCAVADRDGKNAYFGTGDEGKILVAPVHGHGAAPAAAGAGHGATGTATATPEDRPARPLVDLDAAWVTALVMRGDGTLLAGTTPGGRVFAVNPRAAEPPPAPKSDGKHDAKPAAARPAAASAVRELAALRADHVWALVRDERAGVTYAGTGSPGKIFAIDDRTGKVRQIWDSGDKHVVSLLADNDGTLLAGTSEEAILYRIHPVTGRAEALQDFEAEEVRAIVRSPAGLYVAVNDFEKATPAPTPPGPTPAKGTKIGLSAGGPPASAGSLPRPGQRKAKAAIYLIAADGRIEQVFALPDGYLTALAAVEDGSVFAGAGTQGRVYRVMPDRTAALVLDLSERQALALARAGTTLLVGSGDVGGIYRAEPAPAGGGRYLSKVLDAEFPARFGLLRWQGTKVAFETRSGNTGKPDATWSDWKPLDHPQPAGGGGAGRVQSPAARYLQYRATLEGAGSRLRAVTTHYLPQNQRARVTEVALADASAGAAATTPAVASTTGGGRAPHVSVLKLRWKVDNADGDDLVYRLAFREQNEAVWRPLAAGDPLVKAEYDWNTDGIPDGTYVVRVTASDERAQPRELALSSSLESPPLLVDNRKPEVLGLAVKLPFLSGRAKDDASNITAIELAVDGGDWQLVAPADGIFDDLVESFTVRLPGLSPGPHAVTVRAADSADNVGAAQLTVRAP